MKEPGLLRFIILTGLLCMIVCPPSTAEGIRSDSLPPDKAKVIVTFDGDIRPDIVQKYGQVLHKLKIINGLVAVVNRDRIDSLKNEEGIKDVVEDERISWLPPKREKVKEYVSAPVGIAEANEIIVGWNLQEAGIAAANTPPHTNEPNYVGAWSTYSVDGSGVIIAILDTGVNYDLEDLNAPQYLGGYDFTTWPNDDDPIDDHGHGTRVTTDAVAQGEEKIKGVAPSASYYAVKVLDEYGGSDMSHVVLGLDWCVNTANPKPDIVNMSLGISSLGEPLGTQFEAACNAAYDAGIILVAGSGNDAVETPLYPARFDNVMCVGGHAEDQTLYESSNGGADVIAPAKDVPTMNMDGDANYIASGTSHASPHVCGIAALCLQYTRENYITVNNGHLWELIKHSAIDMPLIPDPNFKGKGKARALESIDLIVANWPIDYDFDFCDYAFIDSNNPVYQIGSDVNQTITLTNITDILGNTIETIEDLNVIATHLYYGQPNEPNLPGDSVKVFPTITSLEPNEANSITLSFVYTIPLETTPGLKKTKIEFEFNFLGNDRVMRVAYNEPVSFWYAAIPGDLDLEDDVDLADFSIFAEHWKESDCTEPNWCGRADMDRSGDVNWPDLDILAENWLTTLY